MRLVAPAIVGAISLAVYVRTLLPGIAFGDWGEMQTVPHVLGVAHPTGYPTYILLARFAQLVPIGEVAFRANLLSAVLVSTALAVTVAILLRLGTRPIIAVAAALGLGAVRTVWGVATVAEVNPLHLLFVALLLYSALVWEDGRGTRDLLIGALLVGLALGNHLLILFVAPLVALFVVWVGRRELVARRWSLVAASALVLVGLATYLYIPIAASKSPPLLYNHPLTLDAVLWLVGGAQFRDQFGFLSSSGVTDFTGSLSALFTLLAGRATPVVPIVGMIGLAVLVRQRPAFGLVCTGILVSNVYVWATYLRLEHYLLVPWLVLAIGAGVALEALARALAAPRSLLRGFEPSPVVGAAGVAFAVGLGVTNWQAADRSADRSAETFVDAVLDALPPDAAILSEWDVTTPLWHARYVLGRRPDLLVIDDTNIAFEGWGTRERRIAALMCERPVFILRLREVDLQPTRDAFQVEPFLTVRVARGGPSAVVARQIFRVEPHGSTGCGSESVRRSSPTFRHGPVGDVHAPLGDSRG